jgi:1,5-anhydro-D-fructose reductase (1,5-anhydro-D-mannitol-forming)
MLNWLVVGVGDITTRRVIPAIQAEPRSNLYGIVTRDPKKAEKYGCKVYTDLAKALFDDQIDAVYVASPVALHAPQSILSLRAGKHVLCEKPMAINHAEAESMVKTAKEQNRKLGVAYYRRNYPKVTKAIQLIMEGAIGFPVMAMATFHDWLPVDGKFRSWLIDPAMAGGGPLFDVASHRIDLMNYMFGEPHGVCAHLSNVIHDLEVEDSATLIVEYATAVRGIIDVRWHSKIVRDEFRIIGTEGEINLTPLNGPELVYPGGQLMMPAHDNIHFPCIENFVEHVLDGKPMLSTGETAAKTDWVIQEALPPLDDEQDEEQ